MPDRQHPDQPDRLDRFDRADGVDPTDPRSAFPPPGTPHAPSDDPFEQLLRTRLHQLADHAPTTVRSIDEIRVEHDDRIGGRAALRREGRHRRSAGIGATIAALAGAIGITTVALTGAGTAGAASPEEAVRAFLDAAQAEDVFGMIDAMDPLEVPAARAGVERGRADAVDADIVSEGFQLDGIDGVDLALSDLTFTTEAVLDDVSVVQVAGAVSFDFDPAAFPFGDALAEAIAPDLQPFSETSELADVVAPAMLATVERDGRWYVSASFTIGEYARRGADLPMPAERLVPTGAATPEAAADEFWASMLDLDAASMLALAAPGEGDALLAYGQLILDAWDDSVTDLRTDDFVLSLERTTPSVSGDGDRRRVEAIGYTVRGQVPQPQFVPVFDPTLPTVIGTWDGDGVVVLDPGVPIPATLEGLEVTSYDVYPDGPTNFTMENEDGSVEPFLDESSLPAPGQITIERADGCTKYTGEGAIYLLGGSSSTTMPDGTVVSETVGPSGFGIEQVGDESWQTCQPPSGLSAVWSLFGFGGLTELPALEVVEVDGSWYVSPIGSVAEAILGLVDVGEGGSLIDTPLGGLVVGADRSSLTFMLTGGPVESLTDECQVLAVVDAAGIVTAIVDEPSLAQVRACMSGPIYRDGAMPFPEIGIEMEAPLPVEAEEAVVEADAVESTPAATTP